MRNYLYSISAHIILILILLYPFLHKGSEQLRLENVVWVDFSNEEDRQVKNKPKITPSPKQPVSNPESAPKKAKVTQSSPLPSKPKAELADTRKKQEESLLSADKALKEAEEFEKKKKEEEAARKKKEKEAKVAQFSKLLSQAKTARNERPRENSTIGPESNTDSGNISSRNANVQGSLGTRKILKTPTIKDDSQKQGRVVVKICVGPSGKVISSVYTQIGSTTSDAYLIKLAEKGGSEYLFSPSENTRECGKVVIEFELK